MKAIAGRYGLSEATILAIAAGCDGVLMCAAEPEAQMAALEAVIYAVEQGRLSLRRVEDAMARQRRAKERFLSMPEKRLHADRLRTVLGRDEHQAIAAEMARFA
jgi:beta-N-acetylhexosaminidase